jgi:hypothetical protein
MTVYLARIGSIGMWFATIAAIFLASPSPKQQNKTGRAKADFELREISKEEYERLKVLLL